MVVSGYYTLFTFLCVCLIQGPLLERGKERECRGTGSERFLSGKEYQTRPGSESFKEARECRGTGSERFLSGKEYQTRPESESFKEARE